jgi:hypothetical protein
MLGLFRIAGWIAGFFLFIFVLTHITDPVEGVRIAKSNIDQVIHIIKN